MQRNSTLTKPSKEFIEMYKGDVDFEKLMPQLSMLPELLKVLNKDSSLAIREVTTINTICELMRTTSIGKATFSEIHALLLLYSTIPMTSATAEHTFSTLRRLKNYLRSTMSQERLNHIIILHTHKDRTDMIKLEEIAEEFVAFNECRLQYFGHFVD